MCELGTQDLQGNSQTLSVGGCAPGCRELKISYGNSRQSKVWSNKTITFDALCKRLSTTIRTSETAEEYPGLSKAERDEIKDKGGFVAGHLRDNRRLRKNVTCRSMLVYDIDKASPEFLSDIDGAIPNAGFYYTTHSHRPDHPRARMIIPVTRDMTPDEFGAVARYYAADNAFIDMLDPCSFSPHQLMYWPTTPANGEFLCGRLEGECLSPDAVLASHPDWRDLSLLPTTKEESRVPTSKGGRQKDPLEKEGIVGVFCRAYYPIQTAIDKFLPGVYKMSAVDGRYDYLPGEGSAGVVIYDNKFAFSHHATDPAGGKLCNAFDIVRAHLFGEDESSFKNMSEFAMEQDEVKILFLEEKQSAAREEFKDSDDWKKHLEYKMGKIANTVVNLCLILENDENLKGVVFNQQLDGMEIKGSVPWKHPSKYWRDADDAQLIAYVEQNYGTFSIRNYNVAITKVADDRSYHPIKEYFASLPEWDGTKRAETILIDYLGASDNRYVRAVTKKALCGAVARVLRPGCKFDTMLVLNGPQGVGKSTLISKLGGEWFSDSLSLNDTKDKTAAEKLQGYWILEIGELAGLRKTEVETLRSFLSRQNDIYRAAFGKRPTPHPRQCIFIGTTNAESGYLRDITGNRRFWPVSTPGRGRKHSWELTPEEIGQIWAEAIYLEQHGETLFLSPEEEALAADEQRAAMESDEREGLVREFLEMKLPTDWDSRDLFERRTFINGNDVLGIGPKGTVARKQVSNMEIWCECFGKERANIGRADSNALAAILIKLGWEREPNKQRIPLYGTQYIFVPRHRS